MNYSPRYTPPAIINTGHFKQGTNYKCFREYGTSDWLFFYTYEGSGVIRGKTGSMVVNPGSATLLSPGLTHDYGTNRETGFWKFYWAHFHPWQHWHSFLLQWPQQHSLRTIMVDNNEKHEIIKINLGKMCDYQLTGDPFWEFSAMNSLECALIAIIQAQQDGISNALDNRIADTIHFIGQNLSSKLTLYKLSEISTLSLSRFCHLFTKEMGIAPLQYIIEQRLAKAHYLLESTNLSIKEICRLVGFSSNSYFTRTFTKYTNFSPTHYRQKFNRSNPS